MFGVKIVALGNVNQQGAISIQPNLIMPELTVSKPQALIIDDEVDICYLLRGILRHAKVEASYVTTLAEAQKFLEKEDPTVIFLDNHLSDGLGMDYIRHIKRKHPSSKIIMITAHDTAHDRERAYNEGVDYFISKPFTRETILSTIEKISV